MGHSITLSAKLTNNNPWILFKGGYCCNFRLVVENAFVINLWISTKLVRILKGPEWIKPFAKSYKAHFGKTYKGTKHIKVSHAYKGRNSIWIWKDTTSSPFSYLSAIYINGLTLKSFQSKHTSMSSLTTFMKRLNRYIHLFNLFMKLPLQGPNLFSS